MEDGQLGAAGVRAQKHVESESSIASENVTIPHQNMAGGTAMDQMLDHDRAMLKLVQVKREIFIKGPCFNSLFVSKFAKKGS